MSTTTKASPTFHPVLWLILYIPFGALGGFVGVALTFLATQSGLSITEGSLIIGSQLLVSWLKWLWAPMVDITFSPKKWYVFATVFSGLGVMAMSAVPLGKNTLVLLLIIIAVANLINSIVGMAVEAMIASLTPKDQIGRVSAWFQAGNLGGNGLGGGFGLFLIHTLPQPWMAGAVMGLLFISCCLALIPLPHVIPHAKNQKAVDAVKTVVVSFWGMIKEKVGVMTALMCILPIATGAAQGVLAQAAVAGYWGAGAEQVGLVQGLLSGVITAFGCFLGGWVCNRMNPHKAYGIFGLTLAAVAICMAFSPATVSMYVVWNMIYALGVGLSYAAFTAMALVSIGKAAAATGYNVFASLSNFPLWWLGLLLGWVADTKGPQSMLITEAILGLVGVAVFTLVDRKLTGKMKLAEAN
ncbi:MAG: MFS transporter [Bdellovibrionaceae bacterium]|nr:MFS transporter [Pseudobdellovibrionaceae bacterium]NUM59457.1 MFS transporter [Pseudobdellovibrionaceae bacterium]